MPYLHCTFTLVLRDGSALTPGSGTIVATLLRNALYPLHIHPYLGGAFALTPMPGAVLPTMRAHAV